MPYVYDPSSRWRKFKFEELRELNLSLNIISMEDEIEGASGI
jgi:hypothetical protein